MKNLLATIFAWLSLCCAVNAQSPMVPNGVPFIGFGLLSRSGNAATVPVTASETILATIPIPAGLIGANGQIKVNTYWTTTNSVNNKSLRVRLGTTGVSATQISLVTITTFAGPWVAVSIVDTNSTSAQLVFTEGSRGTDGLVLTSNGSSAIDMTAVQNIYITGQLATTSETVTLNSYSVEYVN